MGGGFSSLSKVMLVSASTREGFDLDYTFGQVEVGVEHIDYSGNCGNLSSGVVPFALKAGIIDAPDGTHEFTLFNTNTSKTVKSTLEVVDGRAATTGDVEIPGVSGTGSAITLSYPQPAGSSNTWRHAAPRSLRIAAAEADLAQAIRAGPVDTDDQRVREAIAAPVIERITLSNPRHLTRIAERR